MPQIVGCTPEFKTLVSDYSNYLTAKKAGNKSVEEDFWTQIQDDEATSFQTDPSDERLAIFNAAKLSAEYDIAKISGTEEDWNTFTTDENNYGPMADIIAD